MNRSRSERTAQLRAEMITRMRPMTDAPPASRRVRLTLVWLYGASAVVAAAGAALPWPRAAVIVQAGAFAAAIGLWFALRRATRLLVDAPDEALDDVLTRLRDAMFRDAYRLLAAVAVLAGAGLLLTATEPTVGPIVAVAAAWLLLILAYGLPVIVAAVGLPEIDDEP